MYVIYNTLLYCKAGWNTAIFSCPNFVGSSYEQETILWGVWGDRGLEQFKGKQARRF